MRPLPLLPGPIDRGLQFPAFFNPRWLRFIGKRAKKLGCQLILVRDLPLAPAAAAVARHLRIPVVLDMAENYPAMIRAIWNHGKAKPVDHLVRNPYLVGLVERHTLGRLDHIIVVIEESADRLVRMGLPPEKITVARNTPWRKRALEGGVSRKHREKADHEALRMCYLGLMELPRGIEVLLDGMELLQRMGVRCHLDLIGDGRDMQMFLNRAREKHLAEECVDFHGHVPNARALDIVQKADLGIVPHITDESWDTTIPNKLFDYMAAGLPVITSDAKPAARIVEETECGSVYRSADPHSLADAVTGFLDPERRTVAGENGRKAILDRYNWESDGGRLVEAVDRVARAI